MSPPAAQVAVAGSLHCDIMVEGPALPRKGETVSGQSWNPKFGGKGRNQAVAAARASAATAMIGVIGADSWGRELQADLAMRGVDCRHLRVAQDAPTGMSVAIFEASGDYGAVIVSGANLDLGESDIDKARDTLATARVLLLQNEVPVAANIAAARAFRAVSSGGRVVLNAAPARPMTPDLIALVDLLVVNAVEAHALGAGSEPVTLDDAAAAAAHLAVQYGSVLVTVGAAGAAYAGTEPAVALAAPQVTAASTHGAGDEYLGCLAARLAAGASMAQAMRAAGAAAAQLVATPEADRD